MAISIVFTVLALFFVRLRVRARQIKGSRFAIDDYLIVIAAVSRSTGSWRIVLTGE